MLDVTKYGGYKSIAIAYYTHIKYTLETKKGDIENTYLVPVPIYKIQKIKTKTDLIEHIKQTIPHKTSETIKDIRIIKNKLFTNSKVNLNGLPIYLAGKTDNNIRYRSALQITFDYDTTKRLKTIFSYLNWQKANKNKGDIWKSITQEDNEKVYDAIIAKMTDEQVNKINPKKFELLQENKYKKKFQNLSLHDQTLVLSELLNLITTRLIPNSTNLKLIDFSASVGRIPFNSFNAI